MIPEGVIHGGGNAGIEPDLCDLPTVELAGGCRQPKGIEVRKRIAKGFSDPVEEVLTVDESHDALDCWLGGHKKITPPEALRRIEQGAIYGVTKIFPDLVWTVKEQGGSSGSFGGQPSREPTRRGGPPTLSPGVALRRRAAHARPGGRSMERVEIPLQTSVFLLHTGMGDTTGEVRFLGRSFLLRRAGCGGDLEQARALLAAADGRYDVIGLDGIPLQLELGPARGPYRPGAALAAAVPSTRVVDGGGLRPALERWAATLAQRAAPGVFARKRVLMVPGLNHGGLAQALASHGGELRWADPELFFGLPALPGVGRRATLEQAAAPTLARLANAPLGRLCPGPDAAPVDPRPFRWADLLAGDAATLRRAAPARLAGKTVVLEAATEEDLADFAARGAALAVVLLPPVQDGAGELGAPAALLEALLTTLRPGLPVPLPEDTFLDLLADIEWTPEIRALQPEEAGLHRFAFVLHPLRVADIHRHPLFRWTRFFPYRLVEAVAARVPPFELGRVTGIRSPATGQRVEGTIYTLCATPRQILGHPPRFTYEKLRKVAHAAERKGARILGLGAFTKVVGDAGITVAHEADIAVTSGNSLTVVATLEAAKQAVVRMGVQDLTRGRAMVVGATGAIGAVCSRLLAQAVHDVVLVSIEPERLLALKHQIQRETPEATVTLATRTDALIGTCDLIVTATSAFGQRILDIARCKPGAVICDVALPCDIGADEAALRPDVLVVESGEVLLPGEVRFSYDINLPPGVAYACLAEGALLALEGRFEDYTLGRRLEIGKVKEIYRLFQKHGLQIAGLRSFGHYVTEEELAGKRALAEQLRGDPARFAELRTEAAARLAEIPATSKGVKVRHRSPAWRRAAAALGTALLALAERPARVGGRA
jgi:predicted amino acid dehydrogenase